MTTAETKNFEVLLEDKRHELIRTIRGKTAGLALEAGETELTDQIQGMAGRDETAIMLDRFSSMLDNVERSLQAISDGSYGLCAMCEEPIAVKRLKAIPWAVHCVGCQEQFEAAQRSLAQAAIHERQLAYLR